jgi:chromosome segregation ATPase
MAKRRQAPKRLVVRKASLAVGTASVVAKIKDAADKMREIQKEEEAQLVSLLKELEAITRDTMNIENETRRQNLLKATLEAEARTRRKELQDLTRQNRSLENSRKEAEKEHRKLSDENARLRAELASLENEVRGLQKEYSDASLEIEKLKATNERLKADAERLTALRREYLKSIGEFKKTRDELLP